MFFYEEGVAKYRCDFTGKYIALDDVQLMNGYKHVSKEAFALLKNDLRLTFWLRILMRLWDYSGGVADISTGVWVICSDVDTMHIWNWGVHRQDKFQSVQDAQKEISRFDRTNSFFHIFRDGIYIHSIIAREGQKHNKCYIIPSEE